LYTVAIIVIGILGITKILPTLVAIIAFPVIGLLFYSESCKTCGASLALQKGNGFIRMNHACRACGEDIL
jgi:hypothetical protein